MKKKTSQRQRAKKKTKAAAAQDVSDTPKAAKEDRRRFLNRMSWIGLGVVVAGGASFFGARSVRATIAEFDLERVGKGTPAVVQIHDPSCPTCNALQQQARKALRGFEDDDVIYLVADISTQQGQSFAARFGVPHVTLLLFDETGAHSGTLQGLRTSDELREAFQSLVAASAQETGS